MLQSHREGEMDFTTTMMMTVEVMMLGLQIDYSRFDSTAHDVITIIIIIIIIVVD
jgi:NADH:ubiquinone oxidoreductase subunit K